MKIRQPSCEAAGPKSAAEIVASLLRSNNDAATISREAALVEKRDSVAKRPASLRREAGKILQGHAPRTVEERIEAGDMNTGRWYPVCACAKGTHRNATALTALQRASGATTWLGVMRCGSVWLCGECAQRVERVRGDEVKRLIETARARGFVVVMLTHTFPHRIAHTCRESMAGLSDALRKMRQRGGYQRFRKALGFVGLVRSTEITYGRNGWHPHVHELWVLDPIEASIAVDKMETCDLEKLVSDKVFPQWEAAAVSVFGDDRAPSREHGIDVSHVWSANDYLAKCPDRAAQLEAAGKSRWGADAEMTKTTVKKGRQSRTFWEILESAGAGDDADRSLVLDYAAGTWRKRRMYWTPSRTTKNGRVAGLRERFEIGEELSDEEIANDELPPLGEQAMEEREKKDPVKVSVDFDLHSLAALTALAPKGHNYVSDLLDRTSADQSILALASADGWVLDRLCDHDDGYARYSAVHHKARREAMARDVFPTEENELQCGAEPVF